jgi:hypothetical protein
MTSLVQFGNFSFHAEPIVAARDSACPGRLMGYLLKGPRGNKKVVAVDHKTGQPSPHEMASLTLWVATVNYGTKKIAERKAGSGV